MVALFAEGELLFDIVFLFRTGWFPSSNRTTGATIKIITTDEEIQIIFQSRYASRKIASETSMPCPKGFPKDIRLTAFPLVSSKYRPIEVTEVCIIKPCPKRRRRKSDIVSKITEEMNENNKQAKDSPSSTRIV